MVIEVAGPPGAGKTTLVQTVLDGCRAAGLQPYGVEEAARVFAGRTLAGRAIAALPPSLARHGLWTVYRVWSALGAVRLAVSHPALLRYVLASQRRRPTAAEARSRRVLYWYFRTAGDYAFLRTKGRPREVLVVDEGFVHRAVQLHASTVERPTRRAVTDYVRLLPPFDMLVAVHAPVAGCVQRVRARGVWLRMRDEGGNVDRFVANTHRAAELAVAAARHQGRRVVDVTNDDDLEASRRALRQELQRALTQIDRGRQPPPRRSPRLPRPTRVVRTVRVRWQSPAIDAETCRAVVGRYGLTTTGRPRNVASGARNGTVVVDTSIGKAVLRRYRAASPRSTVQHEHRVLDVLERCGFPSVRLVRADGTETVVDHAGHLYALFHFEEGVNLSSCLLFRAGRRDLLEAAAHQLAGMHESLRDFRADVPHHLSFRDGSEEIDWYLAALERLSSLEPGSADVRQDHLALRDRRHEIATRVTRLHATLQGAGLPRTVIHGDYGLHNVLFRRDGTAVVTDFELARRDWRLIDLVIVRSRMPAADGKAFLEAYSDRTAVADAEWRHLPDVWEYYRLTGAIRSWHGYFVHGGAHRVSSAVARLREAHQVAEGRLALR